MQLRLSKLLLSVALVFLVTLAAAVAFLHSNYASRTICQQIENLGRNLGDFTLHACGVSLLPPALEVEGIAWKNDSGKEQFYADSVRLQLDSWDLMAGRLQIDSLVIEGAKVDLVFDRSGRLLSPSLPFSLQKSAQPGKVSGDFWPERIILRQSSIDVEIVQTGKLALPRLDATLRLRKLDKFEMKLRGEGGGMWLSNFQGELEKIDLRLNLDGNEWRLEELAFSGSGFNLFARGGGGRSQRKNEPFFDWLLSSLRPEFELKAELDTSKLKRGPNVSQSLTGTLKINLQLTSTGMKGTISGEKLSYKELPKANLFADFEFTSDNLLVNGFRVESSAGNFTGKATFGFRGEKPPVKIEIGLDSLQTKEWLSTFLPKIPVETVVSGNLLVSGNLPSLLAGSFAVQADLNAPSLRVEKLVFPSWAFKGKLSVRPDRLSGNNLSVSCGKSSIVAGLRLVKNGPWKIKAESENFSLDSLSPLLGLKMSGNGTVKLNLELDKKLSGSGELDLQSVEIESRSLGKVKGSVRLDKGHLRADSFTIKGPIGLMVVNGLMKISEPFSVGFMVDLSNTHLPNLLALISGSSPPSWLDGWLDGHMQIGGTIQQPVFDFRVALADARIGSQPVPEGGLVGRFSEETWHFDLAELRLGNGWLYANGQISPEGKLALSVYSTGLKQDSLVWLSPLDGVLAFRWDLNFQASGELRSPLLNGWLKIYDTRWYGTQLQDTLLNARATKEVLEMDGHLFGNAVTFEARVLAEEKLPLQARALFDIKQLENFFPPSWRDFLGSSGFFGRLEVSGPLLDWHHLEGKLEEAKFWATPLGQSFKNLHQTRISLARGNLFIEPVSFSWGEGKLQLMGQASIESGPRVQITSRIPLDALGRWIPGVSRVAGGAELNAMLTGSWNKLWLEGDLKLQLHNLEFRVWPEVLKNITAKLHFDGHGLELVALEGRLGEGRFDGYGRLNWNPLHLAFNFSLDGVRSRVTPSLWMVADGNLQLNKASGARLKLTGDLRIKEALYREKFNLVSFSQGLFRRRVKTVRAYSTEREVLDFGLKIAIPENLRVEYDLGLVKFVADMQGQLQLEGTNERLGLLGELRADSGVINYLTKDFSLEEARVEFEDPFSIEPSVALSAQRTEVVVRPAEEGGMVEYRLRLELSARGENQPQIKLSSDPPLDERDIVALLNLGVTTRDLETIRSEDFLGLGGEILSRSLRFDEKLAHILPLPSQLVQPRYVRIRSSYSTSGRAQSIGAISPRLEMGAKLKLGNEDFDIDYGRSLYDSTDQNVDLSWRISPRVSARLRWEGAEKETPLLDMGDLGLDLRLHWEW